MFVKPFRLRGPYHIDMDFPPLRLDFLVRYLGIDIEVDYTKDETCDLTPLWDFLEEDPHLSQGTPVVVTHQKIRYKDHIRNSRWIHMVWRTRTILTRTSGSLRELPDIFKTGIDAPPRTPFAVEVGRASDVFELLSTLTVPAHASQLALVKLKPSVQEKVRAIHRAYASGALSVVDNPSGLSVVDSKGGLSQC